MSTQKRPREEDQDPAGQSKKTKTISTTKPDGGDIWGTLQSMDVAQLAALAKGNNTKQSTITSLTKPSRSKARIGKATSKAGKKHKVNSALASVSTSNDTSDHAHMLANQWISVGKLNELAKSDGLVFKKGKFSAIEENQVSSAIESYRERHGLTMDDILAIIYPKKSGKNTQKEFWFEITSAVQQRPVIAVYHHVRRKWHEQGRQGAWATDEDNKLRTAVATHGPKWETVSGIVGRTGSDCRDRWRNHLATKSVRTKGPWTEEECNKLKQIIKSMTVDQGKSIDSVHWSAVSAQMGNTRSRQQCRAKWFDSLMPTEKMDGKKPRWSNIDSYILIHKMDSLGARDDTEIDWKLLHDEDWNVWSTNHLQKKWTMLKRAVEDHDELTYPQIMSILRKQWAELPEEQSIRAGRGTKRQFTSAETIEDSDEGSGDSDEPLAVKAKQSPRKGKRVSPAESNGESEEDKEESDA